MAAAAMLNQSGGAMGALVAGCCPTKTPPPRLLADWKDQKLDRPPVPLLSAGPRLGLPW